MWTFHKLGPKIMGHSTNYVKIDSIDKAKLVVIEYISAKKNEMAQKGNNTGQITITITITKNRRKKKIYREKRCQKS